MKKNRGKRNKKIAEKVSTEQPLTKKALMANNVYKNLLNTLIFFDTNALRSTEAGEVAYSFFAFGKPFQVIEKFIIEKHLITNIHLAIPSWAIEELKDQKQRQYKEDIRSFKQLATRLAGMPHIQEIKLPEDDFDCAGYIKEKADEYLEEKGITLLEIKEEMAGIVLQSMMKRVMKDQKYKRPFAHSGKYKDAGFKDNILWESLMHFDGVAEYDKIIFITKDGDYSNCEHEFKEKWNKHISIEKDENNAIAEINKDYELYIEEREIYEFCKSEYFRDYLSDILKEKSEIAIDDQNFKIESFNIVDTFVSVERIPLNQDFEENIIIHSTIKVYYTDGAKREAAIDTTTKLADEVTRDILETNFEIELI